MEKINYKIVVVDDDNDICDSIVAILKASGYTVNGFNDSKSAFKHISENFDNLPDIVITDYKLLGDNGLEFLEKLKNNYPEISVIMMTGYGDKKLTVECLRFGAEDFLDKPLNPATLRNSIAKLIKKRAAIFEMQKRKASSIVHEIANQLTVIKGNAEILKLEKNLDKTIPELLVEQIDAINKSIRNMLDPENFFKKSLKLNKKKLNIKSSIEYTISIMKNHLTNKNMKIEKDLIEVFAEFDENYFRQIITNILLNAVLYSPENTVIQIKLKKSSGKIIIEIADEGPGIPDEFKESIFQYGFRVNQNVKGSGIGLFFVKNVLKAHNGNIEIYDNSPKGSVFKIILNEE